MTTSQNSELKFSSVFCQVGAKDHLHLKRIHGDSPGMPVLMIHGMVENGRIFYHESGKGLGSYLAKQGFDVYVADLRGRGKSIPAISRNSRHGQTESIRDDIPALIDYVLSHSQYKKIHMVAHSWGGVLINSALLRRADLINKVSSAVYFGTKRTVRAKTREKLISIDLIWNTGGAVATRLFGYLPAVQMRIGADNETRKNHRQSVEWIQKEAWVDSEDGFDYAHAAKHLELMPAWYLAGRKDFSLGHRYDVQRFIKESGARNAKYTLLSKQNGAMKDYDHVDMLTAPECLDDHFPQVVEWMKQHQGDAA